MIPTEPTYLIIRSTNHGGLFQNASIWPADSVFSSFGPSSCMPCYSTMTRSPASPFSSSSQFSLCYSYAFFVTQKFPANFTDHQLAMLPSMSICPPCICNHRRKTQVFAHLSTLPLCLPLRHLLALSERNDTLA